MMTDWQKLVAKRPHILIGVAVFLVAADRLLKSLALILGERGEGWFHFSLFLNPGIAFSIPLTEIIFWPLAAAALIALSWLMRRAWINKSLTLPWLIMIALGAASNAFDRMVYGATIDYLMFFNRSVVNIADGMIVLGVIVVALMEQSKNLAPREQAGPTK